MIHRHLDYREDAPIAERGLAAIDDLLERGDLDDWAPIAAAVRDSPSGPLAEAVLSLCRAHPMYGTSALWRVWIERLRSQGPAVAGLGDLRRRRGLRQVDVAAQLGVAQSDISKLESRGDVRVSTLRAYVRATGGDLILRADYADESVPLSPGGDMPG